jgi:hypothetical protein
MYVTSVSEALIDTGVQPAIVSVVGERLARTIRMGPFRLRFGKHANRAAVAILDLSPMAKTYSDFKRAPHNESANPVMAALD